MNECLTCDCYDEDMGCTMPSCDKWYACPVYGLSEEELEVMLKIIFSGDVPASEQERIKKNFFDTINSYLDITGIKKEGE